MTLLLLAGLLTLALWQWVQGRASPGDVAFVMTSYFVVNGYLREVGAHVRNLQQAVNELEDLVLFQRRVPKIVERLGAVPLQPTGGRLEMERVTFTYRNPRKPLSADTSEEHTSELQHLMPTSYAAFYLTTNKTSANKS